MFSCGGHLSFTIDKEKKNLVKDHPRNIPGKSGLIWSKCDFCEENWNVNCLWTINVLMQNEDNSSYGIWTMWAKKYMYFSNIFFFTK